MHTPSFTSVRAFCRPSLTADFDCRQHATQNHREVLSCLSKQHFTPARLTDNRLKRIELAHAACETTRLEYYCGFLLLSLKQTPPSVCHSASTIPREVQIRDMHHYCYISRQECLSSHHCCVCETSKHGGVRAATSIRFVILSTPSTAFDAFVPSSYTI